MQPINSTSTRCPTPGSASGCAAFDYGPGQPNLYRMMRFKQAVVTEGGIEGGLAQFRATFGWPAASAPREFFIESEREFAARHGDPFIETAPGGLPFGNDPPVVHGESNHRPINGVTRSQYVACLQDARIRGRSSAVIVGDRLLLDFQQGELDRVDEAFEWDPAILSAKDGRAWYLEAPDEEKPLRLPEAFNLLGAHSDFFGHWMCEYLPKYAASVQSGTLPRVPVLIDATMPPSHRRSLELLFPERGQIMEIEAFKSAVVDRLWVAPDLSYYPLYDAGIGRFTWDAISVCPARIGPIMAELRRRAASGVAKEAGAGSRVFLARKPARHRRLVNDSVILTEAQRLGFVIVYPEDLDFAAQVGVMQRAREILAAEGSATFLVQFAKPGARTLILSHPMTEAQSDFNEIFRTLGIAMRVLTGPIVRYNAGTPHDSDYIIDAEQFSLVVNEWLGGGVDMV